MSLLGLYQPGSSALHRAPVGAKLLGLAAFAVVLVVLRGPHWAVAGLAVAIALVLVSRTGFVRAVVSLRFLVVLLSFVAAYHAWQTGWERALEVPLDVFSVVLASVAFTATSRVDDMLDAITHGLRPLRRLGVDPERIALAFSLMITAVPGTMDLARETRDAARARGLDRSIRAHTTPLVIRVVGRARDMGDALAARGIGDDDSSD